MDIEQQIRLRAYEIWVAAGMRNGDAERHWLQAELAVTRTIAAAKLAAVKPVVKTKSATSLTSVKSARGSKAAVPRRSKVAAARVGAEASV